MGKSYEDYSFKDIRRKDLLRVTAPHGRTNVDPLTDSGREE